MGNQLASFKAADDGNMIGLGTRHIIQEQHLEMRRTVYKQLHEEQLRYLPKDQDKPRYDIDSSVLPTSHQVILQGIHGDTFQHVTLFLVPKFDFSRGYIAICFSALSVFLLEHAICMETFECRLRMLPTVSWLKYPLLE